MRDGGFDDLKSQTGEPRSPSDDAPHVDPAEALLMRIMGGAGWAPEWVELGKDIREETRRLRAALAAVAGAAPPPSGHFGAERREAERAALRARLEALNRRILHYNLIAPPPSHRFRLNWEAEWEAASSAAPA